MMQEEEDVFQQKLDVIKDTLINVRSTIVKKNL